MRSEIPPDLTMTFVMGGESLSRDEHTFAERNEHSRNITAIRADMLHSTIYHGKELRMSLDTPFTETVDQPIVIRASKWKLLLMALVSLAFVLGGLWMMSSSQSAKVYDVGLAALIFFGLGLLVFLFRLFTPSLLLMIDDEGIHSFYPFWRPLTIRWEEIYSIYPIKIRFINMLTITVSPTGKPTYIARNFKPGKIPFTLRRADDPATAISLPLATAILSSTRAIALIKERYTAQIRQYRIYIQEK
jgi:hypothetical protein